MVDFIHGIWLGLVIGGSPFLAILYWLATMGPLGKVGVMLESEFEA